MSKNLTSSHGNNKRLSSHIQYAIPASRKLLKTMIFDMMSKSYTLVKNPCWNTKPKLKASASEGTNTQKKFEAQLPLKTRAKAGSCKGTGTDKKYEAKGDISQKLHLFLTIYYKFMQSLNL